MIRTMKPLLCLLTLVTGIAPAWVLGVKFD